MPRARESYGSVHVRRLDARLRRIRSRRRPEGDRAGARLLIQPLRELEAHGLVRRHCGQGPARLRPGLPRPWRKRQAARSRPLRSRGDGQGRVHPDGPCRRRARASFGLLDGRAYRTDGRDERWRPYRSPGGRGRRRQDLRAGARARFHGQGNGSGLARRNRRSDAEKLPPLRRRAEGGSAGAGRLLARTALDPHPRRAFSDPPADPGDRGRARPARRPAAGSGRRHSRRQGRRHPGLRPLLDDRARPVQGKRVRFLRWLAGVAPMAKSVAKVPFKRIRERAAKRKGGEKVLASLMPKKPSNKALAKLGDDRVLSEMAARVFSAGFVWSVIDQKWPGFEEAFLEFNPKRLLFQPAEFWEKLASDKRIVRNPQKIRSVRDNARFVSEIAAEHGSFGKFLANWPADDQVGLLDIFAKRGSRLGGFSGQYLLRFLGWDAFVLSGHVLLCLRDAGVAMSATGTSKKDLRAAQAQLNAWKDESGLPMAHVSRICALSIGENDDVARLKEIMQL